MEKFEKQFQELADREQEKVEREREERLKEEAEDANKD